MPDAPRSPSDPGSAQPSAAPRIGIGPLLRQLAAEFPGVSASKVRFLEEQGLVHPARAESGYRKYSEQDLQRLRAVLRLQREQYLPLKVIRELADAGRLEELAAPGGDGVSAPPAAGGPAGAGASSGQNQSPDPEADSAPGHSPELTAAQDGPLSLRELCRQSGAGIPLVRELLSFGLIQEGPGRFNAHDVVVASAALELRSFGVEPRHLRTLRQAADREIGLVEQAVATEATRRTPESARRTAQRAEEITRLCLSVHASLVSGHLQDLQRGIAPQD